MKTVIKVENLKKAYSKDFYAVDGVSFEVKKGEIFGFLGPNGAGKTTTMKILTTLLFPTDGQAIINGYNVMKNPNKARLQFGYVSQDLAVDDDLTGRENLILQARFYGYPKSKIQSRIDELLKLGGLEKQASEYVETYSGGMRKKLDIAGALIHEPNVLFLDEPTLGLDTQSRREIWNYIKHLRDKKGMTVFLTTHYMDEADVICDRVAIIDRGKIKVIDNPELLKKQICGEVITLTLKNKDKLDMNIIEKEFSKLEMVLETKIKNKELILISNKSEDLIPQIFRLVSDLGAELNTISIKKPTLDDVFIKYTGYKFNYEKWDKDKLFNYRVRMERSRR